jgi:uncharacterized protein YycO
MNLRQLAAPILAAACLVLGACATRVDEVPEGRRGAVAGMQLNVQQTALDPANGGRLVRAADLRSGDIILSATNGITSAGIRLLTLAPVSHAAIYLGDDGVAEAVGGGIVVRPLADVLNEESVVVAFRHPALVDDHATRIRDFSKSKVGGSYNHVGVVLLAPFSLERRACELPLLPEAMRDFCLRGIATIQLGAGNNDRFFCSQFVLEAYRSAGLPITDADPRWVSPADILHMREGDVPSMKIHQALVYVGHLKLDASGDSVDRAQIAQ